MNTQLTDAVIQAGALGILLVVLIGVFRLGKLVVEKWFDEMTTVLRDVTGEMRKINEIQIEGFARLTVLMEQLYQSLKKYNGKERA